MYFQFANVIVFFLLAFVLCGLMLGLGLLLRPSNPHPGKLTTYECGEPPSRSGATPHEGRSMSLINTAPEMALTTKIDDFLNWTRKSSVWYMLFGLACCAIEMMQTGGPRADLDRFGAAPRATPRVSDLIIVSGTLTLKMALRTQVLYDQMPDPKYVISMGSCANCGGLFQLAYSVCDGVDKVIPVDVYVPGCPPRPEALTEGLVKLQEKIQQERWLVRTPSAANA